MITVQEAIELVRQNGVQGTVCKLPLHEALNSYLAKDIYSPINLPSFNQSAMDGYAFCFADLNKKMVVTQEIAAGDIRTIHVKPGEAARIFTGAKVPDGCDTVVMQELTVTNGNILEVKDPGLKKNGNIRAEGYQLKKGDLVLKNGEKVTPATIGLLSSLGITDVEVFKKPRVIVLGTGNELIKPGNELVKGQIYESNTAMLIAALANFGIQSTSQCVADDFFQTKNTVQEALKHADILILSGGISVGEYDFVEQALLENGVQKLFYKVNQKPGKPLFFGKKQNQLVFALPGNPAAALNCFYLYVSTAIHMFMGNPDIHLKETKVSMSHTYHKKNGRAEFLKARLTPHELELLEGQGSDVLFSYAKANCLVYLPAEIEFIAKGDPVDVFLLP